MLRPIPRVHLVFTLLAALLVETPARAVVDAQIDNFESGTLAGWGVGSIVPIPPQNVATGGPAGVDDNYMQLGSTGTAGNGSRMAVFNTDQWTGDYGAAGIGAIAMNVNNLGATDLTLRLLFTDGTGMTGDNRAVTTAGKLVPAGSGWTTIAFRIAPSDLTALTGSAAAALAGTTRLFLFHSTPVNFPGSPIAATLGVDNIQALPEPSAAGTCGAGAALLALLARRRARRS